MVDRRRHAPVGRSRRPPTRSSPTGLPQAYRGRSPRDVYESDHVENRKDGRFRWLVSTCLAGAVGTIAIIVVLYGSLDPKESSGGLLPALQRVRDTGLPSLTQAPRPTDGQPWATPRTDRLQVASAGSSTRFIIHETSRKRRNGRDYIENKPFARIVARLSAVPPEVSERIPPFNPFKLYADSAPVGSDAEADQPSQQRGDVAIQVVELLGGILPSEDGQELDTEQVADIVAKVREAETEPGLIRPGFRPEGSDLLRTAQGDRKARIAEPIPPNTTVLQKTVVDGDGDDDPETLEGAETRVLKPSRGQSLAQALVKAGAEPLQAQSMAEAARSIYTASTLPPSAELHITLVPSLTQPNKFDPVRFSLYTDGHDHKVSVARDASGDFVAAAAPAIPKLLRSDQDGGGAQASNLYASLYHSALQQKLEADTVLSILRVHAYDTDFRRRIRPGDTAEFFFDLKDEATTDGPPGELLFTSITAGGETSRFWRFRTPDGIVDYYDEFGDNSKRFLMRRPVRGDNTRLTSGFGMRKHPLINVWRPHNGIDWAAPAGTPILAAGNGTIEEARFRGEYGNYVRIRHANGYQTAYSHMLRFAPGVRSGIKVRQGQVIGFVGSTGLSSGPHLHFEVLVNSRFVDPLKIQVPRERKLTGRQLADFQKERARIDDLMRRAPVSWKAL